jgi:hypothetical protein
MLAESLRETVPAALRERIRVIATLPATLPATAVRPRGTRPTWWPYPLVAAAAAVLVLVVVLIPDSDQPQPAALAEAPTLFRTGGPQEAASDAEPPVRQIADYQWQGVTRGELAGLPATIHTYTDPSARRLLVLTSSERFPEPWTPAR